MLKGRRNTKGNGEERPLSKEEREEGADLPAEEEKNESQSNSNKKEQKERNNRNSGGEEGGERGSSQRRNTLLSLLPRRNSLNNNKNNNNDKDNNNNNTNTNNTDLPILSTEEESVVLRQSYSRSLYHKYKEILGDNYNYAKTNNYYSDVIIASSKNPFEWLPNEVVEIIFRWVGDYREWVRISRVDRRFYMLRYVICYYLYI